MANEWENVETKIDKIIAGSSEPFDVSTIENVRDFLVLVRGRYAIPGVSRGYWSTIILDWESTARGDLEIEIFDDRLEIYHLKPKLEVWYEPHTAGLAFSPELIAELPPVV